MLPPEEILHYPPAACHPATCAHLLPPLLGTPPIAPLVESMASGLVRPRRLHPTYQS